MVAEMKECFSNKGAYEESAELKNNGEMTKLQAFFVLANLFSLFSLLFRKLLFSDRSDGSSCGSPSCFL